MNLVTEIADSFSMLVRIIENTRSVIKAVNDGREYLRRKHPGAGKHFAELLEQMQVTVEGLSRAMAVVTGFRFVVKSNGGSKKDLRRFNDYVIQRKAEIEKLNGEIGKLKGDCERIRELRDNLNKRTKAGQLSSMFRLVGVKTRDSRVELASVVGQFYADDLVMIHAITDILALGTKALEDVESALGPAGSMHPGNIPRAANMLGIYAGAFKEHKKELDGLVKRLEKTARRLKKH